MTTIAKLKDIVDKSKIYQLYQNINNHPLKIDQLNMNEMVEFIIQFYNNTTNLSYILNHQQVQFLERLLKNQEHTDELSSMDTLQKLFIVDDHYQIYDEIKESIENLIKYSYSLEGKEFFLLKDILIGLTKAYGAIEKDELYSRILEYTDTYSKVQIDDLLIKSNYFYHTVGYLKFNSVKGEKEFITDQNLSLVETFLNEFEESLLLSKKKFTLDELLELSHYGIIYSNIYLQDVFESLSQVDPHFNQNQLIDCIIMNIHLLGTGQKIKEYIYEIYPHCKDNAEHFFDLMEKVEDMIPTIHSWAMGGYPYNHALNVFKELPFDKMDEPFINELDSFSSFKSFLDDLDDEDLQDILNPEIDPTKIN